MNSNKRAEIIQTLAWANTHEYLEVEKLLLEELVPTSAESINFTEGDADKPTYKGMVESVKREFGMNGKISAIKLHRQLTFCGLKESKEWVESKFGV